MKRKLLPEIVFKYLHSLDDLEKEKLRRAYILLGGGNLEEDARLLQEFSKKNLNLESKDSNSRNFKENTLNEPALSSPRKPSDWEILAIQIWLNKFKP